MPLALTDLIDHSPDAGGPDLTTAAALFADGVIY